MIKRIATLLLGIGLIGLGVLFFIAPERTFIVQLFLRYWPLFLILAGLVRIAGYLIDRHPNSPVGGMMMTAIGGILLTSNLRGENSLIQIFGNYWFWLLLALILGRVLRQYAHRPADGPRPRAFTPGAVILMVLIVAGGLFSHRLAKNSPISNHLDLPISKLNVFRKYIISDELLTETTSPQSFALQPDSRLIINNSSGDIVVTVASQSEASAHLVNRIRAANEEEAKQKTQNIRLQIESDDRNYRLSVNTPELQEDSKTTLFVTLPGNVKVGLDVVNAQGSVKLSGLRGDHIIRNCENVEVVDNVGRLTVDNSRGPVELTDIQGEVDLVKTELDVSLRRITGAIRINAEDGDVQIEDAKGPITVDATRNIEVQNFGGALKATTRHGAIKLSTSDKIAADIEAASEKGRIRLSLPADSVFRLDAATGRGRVKFRGFEQINLQRHERSSAIGYNISDNAPLINLRSGKGSIQVQASGLALASREDE